MKKRFVIIICMSVIFATCWGCESGNSKVDQVLQNQAQGGDSQQIDASRQAEDSQLADASRQAEDSQQAHASGDVTGTEGIDVDLISLITSVLRPIAHMAIAIKNLASHFMATTKLPV